MGSKEQQSSAPADEGDGGTMTIQQTTSVEGPAAQQRPAEPRRITRRRAAAVSSISELRRLFLRNERPIYSIGATDFNLAGMDRWIGNFKHIAHLDCYDGRNPSVFVPPPRPHEEFCSLEDVTNHLLSHDQVKNYIRARGGKPVAVFLMFDDTTEKLCHDLGMEIWFPPAALRRSCDNKVETVRIGNRAGVPSVPNTLGKVRSYAQLKRMATQAGLGTDLVVQGAFGDSGHTTWFIKDRKQWREHAAEITSEREVKVMKRIEPLGSTLEACVTRCGTVAGPLLTELIGHPELTPYRGGWCGNEVFAGAFDAKLRATARRYTERLGEQLYAEGYRGYFDVDYLVDKLTGELYLGELNPRICGASPLTNHAAFAYADAPLFLFHLLEFSGVDFDLDVDEINDRWAEPESIDSWSQIVIKSTTPEVDILQEAPPSGIWRMAGDGSVDYAGFDYRRDAIQTERDAMFLRILGRDDCRYEGADLGILITRGRSMTDDFALNERARQWVDGLGARYQGRPLGDSACRPLVGSCKLQ
jgi:hypothetical protein